MRASAVLKRSRDALEKLRKKGRGAALHFGIGSPVPRLGPEEVFLQLTHLCNLACEFCESHSKHMEVPVTRRLTYYRNRRTMDRETAWAVIRDLSRLGVDIVTLSGRGEPTVHPQVLEIVGAIQRAGIRARLVTNGLIAEDSFAQDLVRLRCHYVSVSVNAACEETFRVASGRHDLSNGYETVTSFIHRLLAARREKSERLPVVIESNVIYRNNCTDLPGIVDQIVRDRVDYAGFCMMGTVEDTEPLRLDERQRRWILGASGDWERRLICAGVQNNMGEFLRTVREEQRSIRAADNLQRRVPCYSGWMESAIGPDGSVRPCCYCDAPIGNIHDDGGFREVWRSPAYQRFRSACREMHVTGRPICEECFTTCANGPKNMRIHRLRRPFARARQK